MALKSRSVQLPEEVWNLLEYYSKKDDSSVSAVVRKIISNFVLNDFFINEYLPLLKRVGAKGGFGKTLNKEVLIYLEMKDIILTGTFEEQEKQLIDMIGKDEKLFQEIVKYIEKKCKYVDDETILSWTGVPTIKTTGVDIGNSNGGYNRIY